MTDFDASPSSSVSCQTPADAVTQSSSRCSGCQSSESGRISYQPAASGLTVCCWNPGAQRASFQLAIIGTAGPNAAEPGVGIPLPFAVAPRMR